MDEPPHIHTPTCGQRPLRTNTEEWSEFPDQLSPKDPVADRITQRAAAPLEVSRAEDAPCFTAINKNAAVAAAAARLIPTAGSSHPTHCYADHTRVSCLCPSHAPLQS